MEETLDNFLKVGIEAAIAAGKEALEVQRTFGFEMLFKPDGSPATEGDKNAERRIIEIISREFPTHKLIGEEFGEVKNESVSDYTWLYDPIDGTWSFLNQENTACVNIVLLRNKKPILSIVYNPFTNELFKASEGVTTTLNEVALPVTKWGALNKGVFNYQLSNKFIHDIKRILELWSDDKIGKLITQGGSPAYNFALTAKGAHTAYLIGNKNHKPDPWDYTSGTMLVRSAGGQVTDIHGNDIDPLTHTSFIVASTNPFVHEQIINLIQEYEIGK